MAPALTEPISPKEKLTSSGTATATPATAARASRKIDTENYITNNNNNNNNNTTITPLKQSPTLREKRNCNNNNSNSIPVVQVPTTSTIRLTRSRDLQQRLLSSSPKCKDKQQQHQQQQHQQQQPITTQSKTPILTTSGDTVNNEQMGLSTAVLETKNQIINQNTNTATTELIAAAEEEHQNPDAVQKAAAAATKEADTTSTAQLLADLTNEAITADICLRKQLKDVNLVKAVAEGSSSPLQRDRDIVVIKSISTSSPPSNSLDTAHMDTQCSGEEDASTTTKTNDEEGNKYQTLQQGNQEEEEGSQIKEANHVTPEDVKNSNDVVVTEETNKSINECHLSSDVVDSYPPDSPLESDEESKKDGNSKPEIISVQELPPVNTDSTMTASEVEDNLEERLSQLDGTAIDSPPPNNDDVEDDKDDVFKSAQLVMESTHTAAATTTPPRTPTHQQTLAKDMQDIQQQLQHTPPTPVAQQVQAHHHHHMQQQQQLQQVPPQQNCLTPQSTASSINTVGSGNIPQSFIKEAEAGTELEDQDIEEVFKVLKGFEGGGSSDLNVCDLNVLFNEAYMKMNESDIGGTTGGNSQVAVAGVSSSSSSISNSHVSHSHVSVATENPSIQPVKPTELEEAQKDIEERQRQMQCKVDILMRRLRKLQARYMCKHTSEEIAGLFELTARQSSKGVNANHVVENPIGSDPNSQDITKYFQKVIASRPPASDWKSEQEELVPAKQISTLLRKIETVANAQQHCLTPVNASNNNNNNNINPNNFHIAPTKKSKKALLEAQQNAAAAGTTGNSLKNDTTTLDSSAEGRNAEDIIVATLEENVTTELTQVTGLLQTEMYEVQRAIDSDATESSSGGESADEMVVFNNQQQQTLPITKRAAWRYSRDRAAIASRWSWLLSQIADLEIKIRQHSELYQEILKAKGPVISCPRDNGLKVDRNDKDLDDDALEGSSCRTRGFNPAQFRKRKLIQTTNMHTISKKAARPSTIKCGCQWPIHPCALCTGRADPTAPRDLPDTMMMSERIALLDAGYHPVLSFRENVNNALHFEAIAKQPEWQQRVMRCQAKHIAKSVWKAEREAVAGKKFNDGGAPPIKRRYVKKKDRDDKGTQQQQQQQARGTMPTSTDGAAAGATQMASASSCSVNNDQPTTLATTSTTPLVANKSVTKSGKKQTCQILSDVILKNPSNQQPSPLRLSTTSSAAATVTTATAMNSIHQTSDCHHPTSYDPYNLNPTHSSSISNNNSNSSSSKSNKHRKLSSASTAATSHHYNQHNNHLYNGESGFTHHNYDWSGAAGGVDAITARSRTSSPTHGGGTSSNYHSKNERSFDRKNRVSYDIDNIVIPYSVAAATRVEILPYKEIPTPKWRIVNTTTTTATTTTSDETANVETTDNNGNRKITTNGDVLSDDGDNRNSNNNRNNTTPNTFTKNENKPTHVDEIKMLAPSSSSLCDSSRSDHKISDKATSHRQTSMCPTTSNDVVVVVGVDKGSKCLENGETILNNGSCEPAMVEEPVEKKPKMEPNVIKNENIQPPSTSSCTSSASLVHNVDTNDRRMEDDVIGPDDEYCEDISDEAMILRHERALTEERRKFQTFLKFPWSTRSRANRRIDSRAESSGANTPDPSSPAPHTPSVGGGDQDSIPSPSTPSTPLNILDTISEAGDNSTSFLGVGFMSSHSSKRQERRRTTSAKRDFERRSSTPDSKELIPPYEPMRFPLTDEQFEELQSAMPSEHNEDSKRFDDCYFPGGGGGGGLGVGMRTRYCSGPTTAGNSSSKRSSRSSTMCGGERRPKGSLKNTSSIEDVNAMMTLENNCTDNNNMDDEDYDDYPKHHLATNDDHLTADDCDDPGGIHNDDMMMYGDGEDGDYVFANSRRKHGGDSDGDSTETEPFQDDDPNDPEWRGETEDRSRKKAV